MMAKKTLTRRANQAGPERRRYPRIEMLNRIQGQSMSLNLPVAVLDMSTGGFSMQTGVIFHVGAVHRFRLTPDRGEPIVTSARIVHCMRARDPNDSTHYFSGLQFVADETGDELRAVEALMAALPDA
jgi:PilZ domain